MGLGLRSRGSGTLEVLDRTLVLLRSLPRSERSKVASLSGFCVLLAGVQAILTAFQFSYHGDSWARAESAFCAAVAFSSPAGFYGRLVT